MEKIRIIALGPSWKLLLESRKELVVTQAKEMIAELERGREEFTNVLRTRTERTRWWEMRKGKNSMIIPSY